MFFFFPPALHFFNKRIFDSRDYLSLYCYMRELFNLEVSDSCSSLRWTGHPSGRAISQASGIPYPIWGGGESLSSCSWATSASHRLLELSWKWGGYQVRMRSTGGPVSVYIGERPTLNSRFVRFIAVNLIISCILIITFMHSNLSLTCRASYDVATYLKVDVGSCALMYLICQFA